MDITKKIKSYEDACKALNLEPTNLPIVDNIPEKDRKSFLTYYKLTIIVRALNEGWEPNWKDFDEYKYFNWFYIDSSGFVRADTIHSATYMYGYGVSRLCFKNATLARYARKTFESLYLDYLFIEIPQTHNNDTKKTTTMAGEMINGEYFECDGVKWMRTNLGAKKETDDGLYYPWGGTVGYKDGSVCNFIDYNPLSNILSYKSETQLKAMGAIDDNGNLTPEYDAVTQALGDGWRMPTIDDFKSLRTNTNSTWEENFNGSGVNGYKFTLKDGSDYLFFPATGYIYNGGVSLFNRYGGVWTSSAKSLKTAYAHVFNFHSCYYYIHNEYRYAGFPVRGVKTT